MPKYSNFITNRWQAFAAHLLISIALLAVLLGIIFFYWFPYKLIFAGGIDGLKILMGVDLILGPVLTLVVFKAGKKGLMLDLSIIAALQVGCLLFGLSLIYNERPVLQVLADDGVHLIAASDINYYNLQLPDLPGITPKNVLLNLPEDRNAISVIKMSSELVEEKPFILRSDLYVPMQNIDREDYLSRINFIQQVVDPSALNALRNSKQLHSSSTKEAFCEWVPIYSKHISGFACVTKANGIMQLSKASH